MKESINFISRYFNGATLLSLYQMAYQGTESHARLINALLNFIARKPKSICGLVNHFLVNQDQNLNYLYLLEYMYACLCVHIYLYYIHVYVYVYAYM